MPFVSAEHQHRDAHVPTEDRALIDTLNPEQRRGWEALLRSQYREGRRHAKHRGPEITDLLGQPPGSGPFGTGGGRRRPNLEGGS